MLTPLVLTPYLWKGKFRHTDLFSAVVCAVHALQTTPLCLLLPSFKHPWSSAAGRGLLPYCHKSLLLPLNVQNTKSNSPQSFLLWFSQAALRPLDQPWCLTAPSTGFSPVNEVVTCPIALAWLALTLIDVHLALGSFITCCTGAGVEPNMIIAQGPILARLWSTFIYFSITVHTFVKKTEKYLCYKSTEVHMCCLEFWDEITKVILFCHQLSRPAGYQSDLYLLLWK